MRRPIKTMLSVLLGLSLACTLTAFVIRDPVADYTSQDVQLEASVSLSDITTRHSERGVFKSEVSIKQGTVEGAYQAFYGQKMSIAGNDHVDSILVGVTNNLISRIEVWHQGMIVETKEMGFVGEMTRGQTHVMSVVFYDQTNERYKGKSKLYMRYYRGTGFWGDTGTISMDLSPYGDLSGNKELTVFAKSIDGDTLSLPHFSDRRIWKNYASFD